MIMPRNAKGRFIVNTAVALGILIVLLLALFLVSRDVQTQALSIESAKSDLETRIQQLNDLAQSLQSKVMQFGEGEFWSQWFHRYARYGKG